MKKSIIPTPAKYPTEKNTSFNTSILISLMRKIYLLLLLFVPQVLSAQTITTFAGGGSYTTDGYPATATLLFDPAGGVFDKYGNFYLCMNEDCRIVKIDAMGIVTAFAGSSGFCGFSGDGGPATAAGLYGPALGCLDTSGNYYFADVDNARVRRVDHLTGVITTVAGDSVAGFSGDGGYATNAELQDIQSVAIDRFNNLYIADRGNERVRKVSPAGIISTIAGNGINGYSGDGCLADTSAVGGVLFITPDAIGNIYLCLNSEFVYRIVKINTSGVLSTVAGNSAGFYYNGDGIPATAAYIGPESMVLGPDGTIYFVDQVNQRVREIDNHGIIHTIAGNGTLGETGDGGPASAAELYEPDAITIDSCSNLYICEASGDGRVRKITFDSCVHVTGVPVIQKAINSFSIYPNPVIDELHVSSPSPMHCVAVFNLLGQQVAFSNCNSEKEINVPMTGLPGGVYIVRVDGIYAKRVVKELP